MFMFKKIAAPFLFPVPLCLEVLLLGLILLWISRRQMAGKIVATLGVVLLGVLSYESFSEVLLRPLEYKYPPLKSVQDISRVRWVVVLGGGHVSDQRLPVTAQIDDSSLVRLVESIRIHNMLPKTRLILSGGGAFDPVPNARVMADVAIELGVDKAALILETSSKDTKDEAKLIKKIVGNDPFIMVTSASHMPRSMALFRKLGMNPIPAPTGHWVKKTQRTSRHTYFPSVDGLHKAEDAFHEYLGMAWSKLRGEI